MLRRLEGRKHQVMTAVAVARDGHVEHALDVTDVTFRPLTDAQIAAYVATGEPLDKAGAYAIQGKGAALVEGIRGDFFGVMGLPLRLALELLERVGGSYRFTRETGSFFDLPFTLICSRGVYLGGWVWFLVKGSR